MKIIKRLIWPIIILMQFYIYTKDIELTLMAGALAVISFIYGLVAGWEKKND